MYCTSLVRLSKNNYTYLSGQDGKCSVNLPFGPPTSFTVQVAVVVDKKGSWPCNWLSYPKDKGQAADLVKAQVQWWIDRCLCMMKLLHIGATGWPCKWPSNAESQATPDLAPCLVIMKVADTENVPMLTLFLNLLWKRKEVDLEGHLLNLMVSSLVYCHLLTWRWPSNPEI